MKILGTHLIAEYSQCDLSILNDRERLETLMKEAVALSGATLVHSVFHRYNPQGVSGVLVIAESHMSIHTWPEYGYAAVDFFTCGGDVDPFRAHAHLEKVLGAGHALLTELKRGIPSASDEFIDHKPMLHSDKTSPGQRESAS